MQFPVPQFTEVEDKIIGPLTLRQFLIILFTGGLVFLTYSGSKDLVITSFSAMIFGIPGIILAFAPFNGRPMYRSIPIFIAFLTSTKVYVFRKEAVDFQKSVEKSVVVKPDPVKGVLDDDSRSRLKKIQYQLEQRESQEEELLGDRIKNSKIKT